LLAYSQSLFQNLQNAFWSCSIWSVFKQSVELLARSLAKYAYLLVGKQMRINMIHSSKEATQEKGQFPTVQNTPAFVLPSLILTPVSDKIKSLLSNSPL